MRDIRFDVPRGTGRDMPGLAGMPALGVLRFEKCGQIDVHERGAGGELATHRHLNAAVRQLNVGGFYTDPNPDTLAPEALDEVPHCHPLGRILRLVGNVAGEGWPVAY